MAISTTDIRVDLGHSVNIRIFYRRLILCGLTKDEAANLTAHCLGLTIGNTPWKIDEVVHVMFLREIQDKIAS